MLIATSQYGAVSLQKVDRKQLKDPQLRGGETFFCQEKFGTIILHEFKTENYSLRFLLLDLVKKISFILNDNSFSLSTTFCLEGAFSNAATNKTKLELHKGQYLLSGVNRKVPSLHFQNHGQHQVLESSFSIALLQTYFDAFPSLKNYIENGSRSENFSPAHFISAETKKIIHDIFSCPYDNNLRKLYFENKVNDLLFEILLQSFDPSKASGLTQRQTEAVFQTRDIILEDITRHHSIKELAAIVRISEVNLKTGFKQIFGMGLFEYLMQVRMEKAYQLVTQTNTPIKNIAGEIGFEYVANFITAFKKRYKKPPTQLRKG